MTGSGERSARAGSRPYRSSVREEQARRTRRRIVVAARDAFLHRGYPGTTLRGVAAAAQVSLASVEQSFGTKSRLLAHVLDVAIAGDDEPVPVLDRPWAAEATAAGTVTEFLGICAAVLAE